LRRTYGLIAALASRRARISEAQIGCLHRVVTEQGPAPGQGGGDPGAARYRSVEIDVKRPDGSGLEGAPPERIGREMRRFIDELSSRQFACGHPAVQAAYAHYGLVAVHPFIDGNGRAARALGSVYLYRGVRIPLFVFLDQQNDYDDALTAARDHNCLPFVRFVFDAAVAGIALFQEAFKQVRSTLITA
jgi:Fic family protein